MALDSDTEEHLLRDIEQKGLPLAQVSLVDICDDDPAIYGRSGKPRRPVQQRWAKIKRLKPRSYVALLKKYKIPPWHRCMQLRNVGPDTITVLYNTVLFLSFTANGHIGHILVTDSTQTRHRFDTDWSQIRHRLVTEWSQQVKLVTKRLQRGYKVVTKWSHSRKPT
jgi:hypothetical protein